MANGRVTGTQGRANPRLHPPAAGGASVDSNPQRSAAAGERQVVSQAVREDTGGLARRLDSWDNALMSTHPVDINKLTPEQRLRLLEELWESLSRDPALVPLTEAQRQELDRRLDDLESGDLAGIPWDEVLAQIRGRGR